MLHGDPPIDDTEKDFIYMPENPYGIPTDVPIHLLGEGYIQYYLFQNYIQMRGKGAANQMRIAINMQIIAYSK